MEIDFDGVDEVVIKREKAKARKLRKSSWWQNKIQAGICYYCGENVGSGELTMDHVLPLVRGGQSIKSNLVPACKQCNTSKKDALAFDWTPEGASR